MGRAGDLAPWSESGGVQGCGLPTHGQSPPSQRRPVPAPFKLAPHLPNGRHWNHARPVALIEGVGRPCPMRARWGGSVRGLTGSRGVIGVPVLVRGHGRLESSKLATRVRFPSPAPSTSAPGQGRVPLTWGRSFSGARPRWPRPPCCRCAEGEAVQGNRRPRRIPIRIAAVRTPARTLVQDDQGAGSLTALVAGLRPLLCSRHHQQGCGDARFRSRPRMDGDDS